MYKRICNCQRGGRMVFSVQCEIDIVYIHYCTQFSTLHRMGVWGNLLKPPESRATLPPFGTIEGHKWLFQIFSQWEFQKNRFAFISFGKIQILPPCISRSPVHVVLSLVKDQSNDTVLLSVLSRWAVWFNSITIHVFTNTNIFQHFFVYTLWLITIYVLHFQIEVRHTLWMSAVQYFMQ